MELTKHSESIAAPVGDEVTLEYSARVPGERLAWRRRPDNDKEWKDWTDVNRINDKEGVSTRLIVLVSENTPTALYQLPLGGVSEEGFYVYYRAVSSAGAYEKVTAGGEARALALDHDTHTLAHETAYGLKMQTYTARAPSDFSHILTAKMLQSSSTPPPRAPPPTGREAAAPGALLTANGAGAAVLLLLLAAVVLPPPTPRSHVLKKYWTS